MKQRVLWLIKGLGSGGAERLIVNSIPYMNRSAFEYEVAYMLAWKDSLVPEIERSGIKVHCLNYRPGREPVVAYRLTRLLSERQIGLVHAHLPVAGILARIVRRVSNGPPVVYTEHNTWDRYQRVTRFANRWTFRWNDAAIACSEQVRHSIVGHNGRRESRPAVVTVLNGIDVHALDEVRGSPSEVKSEFAIPQSHRLIVHVGTFTPKKGHRYLLDAMRRLVDSNSETSLLLVGQGPIEHAVRDRVQDLRLSEHVVFAGLRHDAPRLMKAADVLALSSLHEGLPLVVLEAMAVGTPVVATKVGGVPEAIEDGRTGVLVDPASPRDLADGLTRVLDDPELGERLRKEADRRVRESFDISTMVRAIEGVYAQTLAASRAA